MRGRKEHYEPTPVFSQFDSPRGLMVNLAKPGNRIVTALSLGCKSFVHYGRSSHGRR